jgi:hypothetical protein
MPKKNWLLLLTLLVLSTVYVYCFTDWFKPKVIEIHSTSRLLRQPRPGANPATIPVLFMFNARYQLTELKVVPLLAWQTNRNALPLWHLVSDSNSIPLKTFAYGQPLKGMRPALPGTHASPLAPDVSYHLTLAAGKARGEHDFTAKAAESANSQ